MAEYFSAEVEGLQELDAALRALPGQFGDRAAQGAVRAGAKVIADEAKSRVRVKTGDLQRSIVVRKPRGHSVAKGPRVVIGFLTPHSRRAHLLEFGTRFAAAFPFMRPAIEAKAQEAFAVVGAQMFKKLERAAKQLSGGRLTKRQRRQFR